VTRPAEIPAGHRVARVLEQYLAECRDNGKRPSVLTLAARLGMSNTTFRRHFPDHARQISNLRASPDPVSRTGADEPPTPYDRLIARNAKLRRANRALTQNLHLAAAQIQRLSLDNARLRDALQTTSNITHIDPARRGTKH
jgi:AraC-like DNA-binding protein